jgi:hypothetical protein
MRTTQSSSQVAPQLFVQELPRPLKILILWKQGLVVELTTAQALWRLKQQSLARMDIQGYEMDMALNPNIMTKKPCGTTNLRTREEGELEVHLHEEDGDGLGEDG